MEKLLTAEEVARLLAVDRRTVYRWRREGRLRGQPIGRMLRFRRAAIDRFLRREVAEYERGRR